MHPHHSRRVIYGPPPLLHRSAVRWRTFLQLGTFGRVVMQLSNAASFIYCLVYLTTRCHDEQFPHNPGGWFIDCGESSYRSWRRRAAAKWRASALVCGCFKHLWGLWYAGCWRHAARFRLSLMALILRDQKRKQLEDCAVPMNMQSADVRFAAFRLPHKLSLVWVFTFLAFPHIRQWLPFSSFSSDVGNEPRARGKTVRCYDHEHRVLCIHLEQTECQWRQKRLISNGKSVWCTRRHWPS